MYDGKSGFTNQIFCFITSILLAHKKGEKVMIVDHFLNDMDKEETTPLSEIINLNALNLFLKQYDLMVVDKNNLQFDLNSVTYGTSERYLDLTAHMKTYYALHGRINIPKHSSMNHMWSDPHPGVVKQLRIHYTINGIQVEEIYPENVSSDIDIHTNGPYTYHFGWINAIDRTMFETILKNITYTDTFLSKAARIQHYIDTTHNVNVIHVRLEDDGIQHLSKMNRLLPHEYKTYLEQKYIDLIQKYISKTDETIILSSSLSNAVLDFLHQHHYKYTLVDKCFEDREKNAIVDFLVSSCCNHIFIGNFNIQLLNGSTFSYYVGSCLDVTKIYIDLNRIHSPEVVVPKR
jgi:hypothetical protein